MHLPCSSIENTSALVNCMESKSEYWDLVSKTVITDLMPFIFVKFCSIIFLFRSVLIMWENKSFSVD